MALSTILPSRPLSRLINTSCLLPVVPPVVSPNREPSLFNGANAAISGTSPNWTTVGSLAIAIPPFSKLGITIF